LRQRPGVALLPLQAQNAYDMRAPGATAAAPQTTQRITGSDQTGVANATALTVDQMATLIIGANAVRVRFAATADLADDVAATDLILGPYSRFDWQVTLLDRFVGLEMASGAGTFEGHVWTSSGTRST